MPDPKDGLYWIRLTPNAEPEVARYEAGRWHVPGRPELATAEIHQIGRPAKAPADAFEMLAEDLNQVGLLNG